MSKHISCATTVLMDAASAPAEIDRVLNGGDPDGDLGTTKLTMSSYVIPLAARLHRRPWPDWH